MQRRQVHANLVSASGINLQFEQSELSEPRVQSPTDPIVSDCFSSTGAPRRHAGSSYAVAADTAGDCSVLRLEPAVHQSNVSLFHEPVRKLRSESPVRFIVFGDNYQPARAPVKAMYDAWPQLSSYPRKFSETV